MSQKQIVFTWALFALIGCVCPVTSVVVQTEQPTVARKAGGVLEGSAIKRTQPTYPPLAKAVRINGAVVVEVVIGEAGQSSCSG